MTDRAHRLSLTRQAELLGISRGSLYYAPRPASEDDLRLMRRIDELIDVRDVDGASMVIHPDMPPQDLDACVL